MQSFQGLGSIDPGHQTRKLLAFRAMVAVPSEPGSDLAERYRARRRELERAHRHRDSALEPRAGGSWLARWMRGLLRAPDGSGLGALAPAIPLPSNGECAITFVGHATALIRYARGRVLTDPCFARSLYSLRRLEPAALPPGALEALDLVLISHAHADHLHAPSLERLDRAVTVIVPPGCDGADRLGFARVVELEPGSSFSAGGVTVTAVPARHRVGLLGRGRALGYVVQGDGPTVYFAGDTGYFPGFLEIGARYRPDVALLPISGYQPRVLRADHLSPLDAIYAFEDLGAQLLVPIHHSAYALGYEPASEPLAWLRSAALARGLGDQVSWLHPGESCVARKAKLE
jgi:L-ascorbate metabolism protein UlaG (beta-lactamase superfamily)